MSQHIIDLKKSNGEQVSVLMGWDRPLQQFFMVLEEPAAKEEMSSYLYSNIDDLQAWGQTDLSYFIEKLNDLGLSIPQPMVEQLLIDKKNNAGNRLVRYEPNGDFAEGPNNTVD